MFVIGITGGIGSGKTTVADILSEAGIKVISADKISRRVTEKDGIAIPELEETFGEEFIKDGALNRKLTASLVFQDRKALDLLNRIVHRYVLAEMGEELDRLEEKRVKVVALDVPIPVKRGFLDRSDVVFTVWSDDESRLKRLAKRGLSRSDALQRIAMQMSREEYREIADAEILNNGGMDDLRQQIEEIIGSELRERGIRYKSFLAEEKSAQKADPDTELSSETDILGNEENPNLAAEIDGEAGILSPDIKDTAKLETKIAEMANNLLSDVEAE